MNILKMIFHTKAVCFAMLASGIDYFIEFMSKLLSG